MINKSFLIFQLILTALSRGLSLSANVLSGDFENANAVRTRGTRPLHVFMTKNVQLREEGFWGTAEFFDNNGNSWLINGIDVDSNGIVKSGDELRKSSLFLFNAPIAAKTVRFHFAPIGIEDSWINTYLMEIQSKAYVIDSKDYYRTDKNAYWGSITLSSSQFADYIVSRVSVSDENADLSFSDYPYLKTIFLDSVSDYDDLLAKSIVWPDESGNEISLFDRWSYIENLYASLEKDDNDYSYIWYYVIGGTILSVGIYLFGRYLYDVGKGKKRH